MNHRQRAGAAFAALVVAICIACPAGAQTNKSKAHAQPAKAAAGASGSQIVASINGENITRSEVADQLVADQTARVSATLPEVADRSRPVASSVGALVLMRMKANGNTPITVSRAE